MSVRANGIGVASGEFTVPAGVPSGTVQVEIIGDQGNRGTSTYTSSGTITTEQRRTVNTVTYRYDPLAQTFTLSEGRLVAGVDLWFSSQGSSPVEIQIRKTTSGYPDQNILAQAVIQPSVISTSSYTRITFRPVWLEANVEYAIVILTNDKTAALRLAEVGKYDSYKRAYVTGQAYSVGVLLSSSNASAWTAHQAMDLTFRLLACRFTETDYEINLGTVTTSHNTDLLIKSTIERVSKETEVEFVVTDGEGKEHRLTEDMPVSLKEEITGEASLKAQLKGSATCSPVIYRGIQLMLGTQAQTADYVTRLIPAGTNTTVRVVYDSYTPGNSTVKVYYQQSDSTWTLIPLTQGVSIGNNEEERTHILENYNRETVRIKLVLEGSVSFRPYVKNLKVTTV